MSIIVYGPQGCGKSTAAEALRRHFKMARIEDNAANPYPDVHNLARFKAGEVLYLTNEPPPGHLMEGRRVISYDAAMAAMRRRKSGNGGSEGREQA